ncbi:hypothetical protein ACFL0W_00760 [Nanoarchaeota archaeon]
MRRHKTYSFWGFHTSTKEWGDIAKGWGAISLAVAIAIGGFKFSFAFIITILISAFTVGIGFLIHELAHKIVAQKYRCWAEFRSFDFMLLIAILLSFSGFIFAAPGAVMISGKISKSQNGKISAAGPLANFGVSGLFLLLYLLFGPTVKMIAYFGAYINALLGLFNLIPFGFFDGRKIMNWNKVFYGIIVGTGIILMIGVQMLF